MFNCSCKLLFISIYSQVKYFRKVGKRFEKIGLSVVCINVGDAIEDIRNFLAQVECNAIQLHDADASAFGQVATDFLPRTYLLDASGEI